MIKLAYLIVLIGNFVVLTAKGNYQEPEDRQNASGAVTKMWHQFILHYIDNYNFNDIYIMTSQNDTQWQEWVHRVFPSIAKHTTAYVTVSTDGNMAPTGHKTLIITPFWTISHTGLLSQELSSVGDNDHVWWLVIARSSTLHSLLKQVYLPLLNQASFAVAEVNNITMWEAYQLVVGAKQRVEAVGRWVWQRNNGAPPLLQVPLEEVVPRRTDLTGLHIRCVSLESRPSIFTQVLPDESVRITGWMAELWDEMQMMSNFTYHCRMPKDREWGAPKPGGGWTGMVGEVAEGHADAIVGPISHTGARSTVIDFCMGIERSGFHLVLRRPTTNDSVWTNFTREFEWGAWLVVGLLLFVASLVFYATGFSPTERETLSLGDAFFMTFGSLCAQSTSLELTSISARIAFLTVYLSSMLLYAFYTSCLISQLAVTTYNLPFATLQELYQQRTAYSFGFVKGYSVEEYFKFAKTGLYRQVWKDMVEPRYDSLARTEDEGIQRALKSRQYVHFAYGSEYQFQYANNCDLIMLPVKYMQATGTFAVAKNSPLRRIFTYHLMRLRDTGISHRFHRHWQPRPTNCVSAELKAFTIDNLITAHFVLICALVLSVGFAGIECSRFAKFKSQRTTREIGYRTRKASNISLITQRSLPPRFCNTK